MFQPAPVDSRMSLGDLKRLVKTGEGTFLEFKRTISSPEKIAREIAAFANTSGGTMLIGVDDDKSLIGVDSYFEQEYLLDQALNDVCIPAVEASVEVVAFHKRDIVLVRVDESDNKPVYVKDKGKKTVYVRERDQSVRASYERMQLLKIKKRSNGITFHYGPDEQKLFRYLSEFDKITVIEYSNLINSGKWKASRILVNLASLGVLRFFDHDKKEYFSLSQTGF
jgi:predicted HTH transcriptional regulator